MLIEVIRKELTIELEKEFEAKLASRLDEAKKASEEAVSAALRANAQQRIRKGKGPSASEFPVVCEPKTLAQSTKQLQNAKDRMQKMQKDLMQRVLDAGLFHSTETSLAQELVRKRIAKARANQKHCAAPVKEYLLAEKQWLEARAKHDVFTNAGGISGLLYDKDRLAHRERIVRKAMNDEERASVDDERSRHRQLIRSRIHRLDDQLY